jgi:hypothetical protein
VLTSNFIGTLEIASMYCVCYTYSGNNTIHRGGAISYEVAKAWVDRLSKKYSDMHHWVEVV